jgi:hypothetical protein
VSRDGVLVSLTKSRVVCLRKGRHFHDLEPSCSFFRPSIFDLFYLFFFFCCVGTLVKFLNGGHQVVKWVYTTRILLWPRVQSGLLASEIET